MSAIYGLDSEPTVLVVHGPGHADGSPELVAGLRLEGLVVESTLGYETAAPAVVEHAPHIVVLDVGQVGLAVVDVCQHLAVRSRVPVLVLADRSGEAETVLALEVGADDVVVRPCGSRELAARLRALLRRQRLDRSVHEPELRLSVSDADVVEVGDLRIDRRRHEVFLAGTKIHLPRKEHSLLAVLLGRAGRVVTRDELIEHVWGIEYVGDTKTLDAHIKRLRSRIERDPAAPERIVTVRGVGFLYDGEPAAPVDVVPAELVTVVDDDDWSGSGSWIRSAGSGT